MQYKVTKIQKYGKGCFTSEKIGVQYYFVVYAHVFANEDGTRYWPVRFMIMFDGEDICEFTGKDCWDPEDVRTMKTELACSAADCIIGCNKTIKDVIADANATIERYAA